MLTNELVVDMRHRPPEIIISDDAFSGPIKHIISSIAERHNLTISWQEVPWPRTLDRAKKGNTDIIPRHSLTDERKNYLMPMLLGFEKRQVHYLLAPQHAEPHTYTQFTDFNELTFGLLRGSFYSDNIVSMQKDENVVYATNIEQLMSLLLKNRIDVLPIQNISWAESAYNNIKRKHKPMYKVAEYREEFLSGKFISMSKKSTFKNQFHDFNCDLYQMRANGKVNEVYSRFNIQPYVQDLTHPLSKQQQLSCTTKKAANN